MGSIKQIAIKHIAIKHIAIKHIAIEDIGGIMGTMMRIRLLTSIALVTAVTTTLVSASPSLARHTPKFTTVISGLNAPRGLTFDGRDNLYVAESGTAGSDPAGLTNTGKVTKFKHGSLHPVWSTSFESLYASEDPSSPPRSVGQRLRQGDCLHPQRERAPIP